MAAAVVVLALNLPLLRQPAQGGRWHGRGGDSLAVRQTVCAGPEHEPGQHRATHDGSDNGNKQIYMAAGHVEIMPSNWYQQRERLLCLPAWLPG